MRSYNSLNLFWIHIRYIEFMAKKLYSAFPLCKVDDVEKLIQLIKSNGGFHRKDYDRLMRKADESSQSTRIRRRLIKYVRPLIDCYFPEISDMDALLKPIAICQSDSSDKDFWNKDYKASDFVIINGKITLGKYYLKSVRIPQIHKSWLKDIDHIFHIAPEYSRDGNIKSFEFHFVPYTDLTLLLNEVVRQKEVQAKQRELREVHRKWNNILYDYLQMRHNINGIKKRSVKDVFNMINVQIEKENCAEILFFDISNGNKPNVKVPMSDVTVVDGQISVLTKNISFTLQPYYGDAIDKCSSCLIRRDDDIWVKEGVLFPNENGYKETPSWGGFLEILSGKYDESIIQENVEDLKF